MARIFVVCGLLVLNWLGFTGGAQAATAGLELRAPTTVNLGSQVDVGVYFTGDQFYAASDISLDFNSSILDFQNWEPGASILAYSLLDQMPMSESAPFTGNLSDLGTGLLLAIVHFDAVGLGNTNITINTSDLLLFTAPGSTDFGTLFPTEQISFTSTQVNVVPEPEIVGLIVFGLIVTSIAGFRRGHGWMIK